MKILHLTLKKKWFDMILSGEKKEEYREIKPYWLKRLCLNDPIRIHDMIEFNTDYRAIEFKNGYSKNAPTMLIELERIAVGKCKGDWSDMAIEDHFILMLGKILETKNIN